MHTDPDSLHQRVVRIYQPAKPATMSGRAGTKHWRVDFDVLQGSGRWESPLMGWASTYVAPLTQCGLAAGAVHEV